MDRLMVGWCTAPVPWAATASTPTLSSWVASSTGVATAWNRNQFPKLRIRSPPLRFEAMTSAAQTKIRLRICGE